MILGLIGRFTAYRNISHLFGYRTSRAMKSKKSWVFANNFMFSYLFIVGVLLFILSYFKIMQSSLILNLVGLTGLLLGVLYVEVKLKRIQKDKN